MDQKNKATPPPAQAPKTVEDKVKKARTNLETSVRDFIKLLDDKTLDKNKGPAHKNTEKQVADNLFKSVVGLERENSGEGIMAMGLTTLRTNLKIRDRVNELEFLLLSTIKELRNIEQQLGIKNDKTKGKS